MRTEKLIHIVNCHAEGEVGNVIVGGVAPPPGDTIWAQSRWLFADQSLRQFVLNEPRGGVYQHVNLLVPAKHPDAAFGFIIMEPEHNPPMSGSNSICVATVLLDTGLIPMQEPITRFTLEAPAGLVQMTAHCANGKAESIEVQNVPSFVDQQQVPLEVEGFGTLIVDTGYGGDSFVFVDAHTLGFALVPDEAKELAETGVRITAAANEQLGFTHPTNPDWTHISFCQMTTPIEEKAGVLYGKSTVVIDPGKLDRCPTGTGCSARMALLHAQGRMTVGDKFVGLSIIESRFDCSLVGETLVGEKSAVIPTVRGSAWITGTQQLMLDPTDRWPHGYRLTDTWPKMK